MSEAPHTASQPPVISSPPTEGHENHLLTPPRRTPPGFDSHSRTVPGVDTPGYSRRTPRGFRIGSQYAQSTAKHSFIAAHRSAHPQRGTASAEPGTSLHLSTTHRSTHSQRGTGNAEPGTSRHLSTTHRSTHPQRGKGNAEPGTSSHLSTTHRFAHPQRGTGNAEPGTSRHLSTTHRSAHPQRGTASAEPGTSPLYLSPLTSHLSTSPSHAPKSRRRREVVRAVAASSTRRAGEGSGITECVCRSKPGGSAV